MASRNSGSSSSKKAVNKNNDNGGATSSSKSVLDRSASDSVHEWTKKAESGWERFGDLVEDHWDEFCDYLEEDNKPDIIHWISIHILRRLTVETPVVILFCLLCVMVHILQATVWSGLNTFLAVRDTFDITSPMQLPRLFTHVIAHDGTLQHIRGNLTHILLVGPSAEHVYGSRCILLVIVLVALFSSLVHIVVGSSHTHQLGASGVVFSVILLNSLVAAASGTIPISFVLTAGLWCFDELYKFLFGHDGISHHAHLTGAVVGTVVAYYSVGAKQNLHANVIEPTSQNRSMIASKRIPFQSWVKKIRKSGEKKEN
jgi:membrane associated rhomboid family serine protease